MRSRSVAALALLLVPFALWASEETAEPSSSLKTYPAKSSARDVELPSALVTRIENAYRDFLTKDDPAAKPQIRRALLDVSVEMTQKKNAALHEDVRVQTPLGGGVIDLAEFTTSLRGIFNLKIITRKEKDVVTPQHVYFVSRAKSREFGGDSFGAGCGKMAEVTTFFSKAMRGAGFELYTADQRYIPVLGGTFVVVAFTKDALYAGSVSFTDSRFPNMFCE